MADRYVAQFNEQWNGKTLWTVRDQVRDCTVLTTKFKHTAVNAAAKLNDDARREEATHGA